MTDTASPLQDIADRERRVPEQLDEGLHVVGDERGLVSLEHLGNLGHHVRTVHLGRAAHRAVPVEIRLTPAKEQV